MKKVFQGVLAPIAYFVVFIGAVLLCVLLYLLDKVSGGRAFRHLEIMRGDSREDREFADMIDESFHRAPHVGENKRLGLFSL